MAHWLESLLSVSAIYFTTDHFISLSCKGSTYPLDLVRSRLSIATASIPIRSPPSSVAVTSAKQTLSSAYHTSSHTTPSSSVSIRQTVLSASELTIWGMTLKVMREEGGVRGLYRGLVATAMGVAPYVGINFAAYEALRGIITPPGKVTVLRKLACGALAGESIQFSVSLQNKILLALICTFRINITDVDLSI